jgi:RNA recognition motif.
MQGSKLYVGNLKYSVTNDQLTELFGNHGEVKSVNIIEGKGFGFSRKCLHQKKLEKLKMR